MSEFDALADRLTATGAASMPAAEAPRTVASARPAGPGIKPFRLSGPGVTPERASLSRMIGRGSHAELPQHNALFSLHLPHDATPDWGQTLVLQGPFGAIELAQGPRFLRALTGIDVSTELTADDARWEWLQGALVARLAGTPFADTGHIARDAQPDDADLAILRITLRTGAHAVTTYARAGGADWLAFLGRSSWTLERLPFAEFAGLPFEAPIIVARHTLPRHALRGLAASDIILPDSVLFGTRGAGQLQIGVRRARVRYLEPNAFRVLRVEVNVESPGLDDGGYGGEDAEPLPAEQENPEAPVDEAELDGVPVSLEFELGKVRMSLGQLRALGPESIVTFEGTPSSIAIRCGGRLLGRGELLDVHGSLGIRILEWGPK